MCVCVKMLIPVVSGCMLCVYFRYFFLFKGRFYRCTCTAKGYCSRSVYVYVAIFSSAFRCRSNFNISLYL